MLVADGKVQPFDGDLDDYKQWAKAYHARGGRRDEKPAAVVSRKDERRAEAAVRQREAQARKPFEKRLAAIEAELEPLSTESKEMEMWLASSDAYEESNKERLQASLRRRAEIAQRIEALENDWLWIHAEMERAVAEATTG
jgi:ATP-binding cassette subfamily F protein 3